MLKVFQKWARRGRPQVRAVERIIARTQRGLEYVNARKDIDDYKQKLWPDEELRRTVIAEKCVARMYRRRILRLRCYKFCLSLRPS